MFTIVSKRVNVTDSKNYFDMVFHFSCFVYQHLYRYTFSVTKKYIDRVLKIPAKEDRTNPGP